MTRHFETKLEKITPKYKDKYLIEITCDFNDGDFVNSKLILEPSEFTDFKKLILSYVMTDYNKSHIAENDSFGETWNNSTYADVGNNWLVNYLIDNNFLLYGYEGYCHSIVSLDITYYDKDSEAFNVSLIDIRKEFGSITEFRKFIVTCEDYGGDLNLLIEEEEPNLDFGEYPEDDDIDEEYDEDEYTEKDDILGNALYFGDEVVQVLYKDINRRGYFTIAENYEVLKYNKKYTNVVRLDALNDYEITKSNKPGFLHVKVKKAKKINLDDYIIIPEHDSLTGRYSSKFINKFDYNPIEQAKHEILDYIYKELSNKPHFQNEYSIGLEEVIKAIKNV